jgi:hypothetical protein
MTQATQKSLDYFIIRFLSFYQINATKIVYYTHFLRRTVTLVLLTAFAVPQPTRVTIKRLIKLV